MKKNKHNKKKKLLSVKEFADGIINQNKFILSKAITLLESNKPEHNKLAREIIELIMPHTGKSLRIAITGIPGVGKSTFIESLGKYVLEENNKLAVLAIDPTSQKSKGSILGDKTRMEKLTTNDNVFVRPSPAGKTLGGVNRKTRETILLCEAAGFNIVFIETVGVGQSEIAVHSMIDCFLLLMLPGAGDELQGIKRGIMEMADIIAINKVDQNNEKLVNNAISNYKNALHLFPPSASEWISKVYSCSSLKDTGIHSIWQSIKAFENHIKQNKYFSLQRNEQSKYWLKETINDYLLNIFYKNDTIANELKTIEKEVLKGKISSFKAADKLIEKFEELNK